MLIHAKPHYHYVTRLLLDLVQAGELPMIAALEVEPLYGYAGRITYMNGAVRMFRATHLGINDDGATEIARDKGYTKYFLQQSGYHTPIGKVFLLPFFQQLIDQRLSKYGFSDYALIDQIEGYIESIGGYPCFVKPNTESQGKGVYKCCNRDDLHAALNEYQRERYQTLIVEQLVPYADYRVVVYDDAMIACYLRRPLAVTGDGISSIRALLEAYQTRLHHRSRHALINLSDPRILNKLARDGRTLDTIPATGELIPIFEFSNLSAGGDAEDVTAQIHPQWRDLCIEITAKLGLRLCGLDFACADITDPNAAYSVIEANPAPILEHYAAMGEAQLNTVRGLYRRIFSEIKIDFKQALPRQV